MYIGKTIIHKKTNFGKTKEPVEIYARQGIEGNIYYESYSDKIVGSRIFNTYEELRRAYWSVLVSIDEVHFLSLCVTSFQVVGLDYQKEVLAA